MTSDLDFSEIQDWQRANQEYLNASLAQVRERLRLHVARASGDQETVSLAEENLAKAQLDLEKAAERLPAASSLDLLRGSFSLSDFECGLLLLCAGVELDSSIASLCASANGDPRQRNPTFGLAASVLPGAYWRALAPDASLRHWHLIEVGKGDTLATSPLRIDERVLHHLMGLVCLDDHLKGIVEPVSEYSDLPPSHLSLAEQIANIWSRGSKWPLIQLCGAEGVGKRAIAASACEALGVQLYTLSGTDIPAASAEREELARLWEREAVLSGRALVVDCEELSEKDFGPVRSFLERLRGIIVATSRQPLRLHRRSTLRLDVKKPSPEEQIDLWQRCLGPLNRDLDGELDIVVSQFDLGPKGILEAGSEALSSMARGGDETLGPLLWKACRGQARPRLDDMAQRIEPMATWDDLVLPEAQLQILKEMGAHLRHSAKVYRRWGFASKSSHGLGISALFAGESGTGKTLAAEVLANDLDLDLYRIDLSQVVNKYIGETEKNLRRVFDAAEGGGCILLFDEADALFGKRSDVKDSHDRYANIEVGYLLQRMEAYRGLAILTTNIRSALDKAFLRRIRFIVQFPFPGEAERKEIWRCIFPGKTPLDGLDYDKLARLNVAGGSIRNMALYSAFLAAEEDMPVSMRHLLRAARVEYCKLERPLSGTEIGGWV